MGSVCISDTLYFSKRRASLWLLSCLLLWWVSSSAVAGSSASLHRRELQSTSSACTGTTGSCREVNEGVHVVEVDLVDKECVVMYDAWFDGPTVKSPNGTSERDSPLECCKACFEEESCSVWTYCSKADGCVLPGSPSRRLGHRGCRLISLPNFHPIFNQSSGFRVVGPSVPFVSGAPVVLTLPKVAGYQINPGVDLNSQFDYTCPGSLQRDACELNGTAQELAQLCNDDPQCKGFVYLPTGMDFQSDPMGILKGGDGTESIPLSSLAVNPSTALFLKDTVVYSEDDAGGDSNQTVLYVVLPISAAVAAAAFVVLAVVAVRVHRQRRLEAGAGQAAAGGAGKQPPLDGHLTAAGQPGCRVGGGGGCTAVLQTAGAGGGGDVGVEDSLELAIVHGALQQQQASSAGSSLHLRQPTPSSFRQPAAAHPVVGAAASRNIPPPLPSHSQQQGGGAGGVLRQLPPAPHHQQFPAPALLPAQQRGQRHLSSQVAELESALILELLRRLGGEGEEESGSLSVSASHRGSGRESDTPSWEMLSDLGGSGNGRGAGGESCGESRSSGRALLQGGRSEDSTPAISSGESSLEVGGGGGGGGTTLPLPARGHRLQPPTPPQNLQLAGAWGGTAGGSSGASGGSMQGGGGGEEGVGPHLPWSDWAVQAGEVEVCRRPDGSWWQLGSGAFGTVYKGLLHGVQPVAVKLLHADTDPRVVHEFVKEITLLKSLRNRNIVQFLGASFQAPSAMLVTEYMELGDLWRALPLRTVGGDRIFRWDRRGHRVALDVARGLHYLHHKRVVHLDLKSANILLSRHGTAKICDVGFARVLTRDCVSVRGGHAGTLAWSAPEVLAGRRCSEKVDIYSFGVVLWEICTGETPIPGDMRPLLVPEECPQEVADLQARCVSQVPEERPSAPELVQLLGSFT